MSYSSDKKARKRNLSTLAFALIYITVGGALIYWNFTGAISSVVFGIGMFVLIIVSVLFKVATDFFRKKK